MENLEKTFQTAASPIEAEDFYTRFLDSYRQKTKKEPNVSEDNKNFLKIFR